MKNYNITFKDAGFFVELINFENTVDNISDASGIDFVFPLPNFLEEAKESTENINVNETAISVLNMMSSEKATILGKIISSFKKQISWREFYFLCKIFEVYDDVLKVSMNTIFSFVYTKFLRLDAKYPEYSYSFISREKEKLLHYRGSKKKKYVLLLSAASVELSNIANELWALSLDFHVSENNIYINHSYFNGFKNLEENFGDYKLLEDI